MEFYKETIMGQVLTQVQADKNNTQYFEQIEDLLEDISDMEYLDSDVVRWHKHGVIVTSREITKSEADPEWVYVETDDVSECSWLLEELNDIYDPNVADVNRLFTTVGYLLNVYTEKFDHINDILRMTAVTSTVFLHPDHVGKDKFRIHPIELPPFGSDF